MLYECLITWVGLYAAYIAKQRRLANIRHRKQAIERRRYQRQIERQGYYTEHISYLLAGGQPCLRSTLYFDLNGVQLTKEQVAALQIEDDQHL